RSLFLRSRVGLSMESSCALSVSRALECERGRQLMALMGIELTGVPFEEGRTFGDASAYELLAGRAHFALDPTHPANVVITDIELAAREADGLVHCTAEVSILRPREPSRRNRRLLLD